MNAFTDEQLDRLTEAMLPLLADKTESEASLIIQLVLYWLLSESDYSYQRWLDLFSAAESVIDAYTASRKSGAHHE
ncbi:hypothetical protein [Enterococcus songbeiensis]|uniref:hypothetical protein n=1 Tax=Enterococcus songbeiensis TaxID=2559927 RepID=UPI0010F59E81|nr:hypothetical protein [Enterococcus songbeiensis]